MSDSDKIMWTIERDPVLRSTIVVVGLLDAAPHWPTLRATFERGTELLPRLRQVVREAPLPAGPNRWVDDPQFDIDYHLRHVVAPAGDLRAVLDLAAPITSDAFDRARPPWELTVVDGLADGRAAFVLKLHHTISDGVGGIQLAELMFEPETHATDEHDHGRRGADAHRAATDAPATGPSGPLHAALRTVTGALLDPVDTVRKATATAGSVLRILQPVTRPLSPVLVGRGLTRRFDAFEIPLDDLRRVAHATDATVNAVFLAGAAGGMARYHAALGAPTPELRITMPINLRRPGEPLGGNRFTPARFVLPIGDPDPHARVRVARDLVRRWRDEPAVALTTRLATVLSALPPPLLTAVFRSMLRNVDVDLVDVPGVAHAVRLGGARLERMWAFAPPTGTAVSITLLSHVGTGCIGIEADRAAVTDPDLLTSCLLESFAELVTSVREPAHR